MRPTLAVAPAGVLVPWSGDGGLAAHCSLEEDDERQGLVESYERAAVNYLDGFSGRLGRCILRQKWVVPLSSQPSVIYPPFPDSREFAIERQDEASWVAAAAPAFEVISGCVHLSDYPVDLEGLHLTFWAGWEKSSDVPEDIKQIVRFLVAYWFEGRGDSMGVNLSTHHTPVAVEALLAPLIHLDV